MEAVRIKDAEGPNPAYNVAEAAKAGDDYDIPQTVIYKAGQTVSDPHAWILCVLAIPLATPKDDECKAKVSEFLNHSGRKSQLARLKQMASPAVFKTLPVSMQNHVRTVAEKWLPAAEQPADTKDAKGKGDKS